LCYLSLAWPRAHAWSGATIASPTSGIRIVARRALGTLRSVISARNRRVIAVPLIVIGALFAISAVLLMSRGGGGDVPKAAALLLPSSAQRQRMADPLLGWYHPRATVRCLKKRAPSSRYKRRRHVLTTTLPLVSDRRGRVKLYFFRSRRAAARQERLFRAPLRQKKAIGNVLVVGRGVADAVALKVLIPCLR
jgi:hypothetical protein